VRVLEAARRDEANGVASEELERRPVARIGLAGRVGLVSRVRNQRYQPYPAYQP